MRFIVRPVMHGQKVPVTTQLVNFVLTDQKLQMKKITEEKKLKIEFAPGCFDSFEGSQEELDQLIKEITRMVESGELHEKSRQIDFDDPTEDDLEAIEHLSQVGFSNERKIQ